MDPLMEEWYVMFKGAGESADDQGPNEKNATCLTCGEDSTRCAGHYGFIKLYLPVFHVGYFRPTINMLSCVCKVS